MSSELSAPQELNIPVEVCSRVPLTLWSKLGRVAAATMVLAGGTLVTFGTGEAMSPAPAVAYDAGTGDYPWADASHVPQPPATDTLTWGYTDKAVCDGKSSAYDCGSFKAGSYYIRDQWGYDLRNCTSYVAWRLGAEFGADASSLGNAKDWDDNAPGKGWTVRPQGQKPEMGDIAQWDSGGGGFGHVEFVTGVNDDGSVNTDGYNGDFMGDFTPATNVRAEHYIDINGPNPANFALKIGSSGGGGGGAGGQGSGVTTGAFKGSDHLVVNQPLYQNQYITTPDGQYVLMLQADGNLVEYGPGYQPIWANGKAGSGGGFVVVQPDGNVVEYMPDGHTAIWSNGRPNSGSNNSLWLQTDGNLVEYTGMGAAVWSDGQARPGYPPAFKGGNTLGVNQGLYQNQYIRSANGQHFALMQTDGSFVIYGPGYHVTGGAGPAASGAGFIVLQPDGNVVEYMPDGHTPVWGNGQVNSGGNYVVMQDDGNLVEYTANNMPVWATNTAGKI